MSRSIRRRLVVAGTIAIALIGLVNVAEAHDFWLVPDAFQIADGETLEVRGQTSSKSTSADSTAVVGVVARYHAALASGDSATALQLLAPDAVILESGGVESYSEYRSHHLPGDMAFAAAIPFKRTVTRVAIRGDMAWVASTSITQGEFRGRPINSAGAELMVLTRTVAGWRISAIHWSSRARRP